MTQEALKLAQHWSDCAVHREPAYPNGECDCGGIVTVADYTALSDKYVALSDKYVALKAQHKEQEPVPGPLYATPPQRTWVDLTDEEIFGLFGRFTTMTGKSWLDLYRMTEAKLKEKNGYTEEKNT